MTTETLPTRAASYSRRKNVGTIALSGICDIFEATLLRDAFVKAIQDDAAKSIVVDCSGLTRIDTSAVQLLASFKSSAGTSSKGWQVLNISENVKKYLVSAGLLSL